MTQNTVMEGSYLEGDELHKFRNLVKKATLKGRRMLLYCT